MSQHLNNNCATLYITRLLDFSTSTSAKFSIMIYICIVMYFPESSTPVCIKMSARFSYRQIKGFAGNFATDHLSINMQNTFHRLAKDTLDWSAQEPIRHPQDPGSGFLSNQSEPARIRLAHTEGLRTCRRRDVLM